MCISLKNKCALRLNGDGLIKFKIILEIIPHLIYLFGYFVFHILMNAFLHLAEFLYTYIKIITMTYYYSIIFCGQTWHDVVTTRV